MGRSKVPIVRITNATARQATFTKRHVNLIKKAYELSVLCDVDAAVLTFSPSGKLSHFSSHGRVEDVLSRYINLPDHEKETRVENEANLLEMLRRIKCENQMAAQQAPLSSSSSEAKSDYEELTSELSRHQQHLHCLQKYKRFFNIDLEKQKEPPMTLRHYEEHQRMLMRILAETTKRKNVLLQKCISSRESSSSSLPNINGSLLQLHQEAVLNMQPEGTYIQPERHGLHVQPPQEGFCMQPQADGAFLQLQQNVLNLQEVPEAEGFQLRAEVPDIPTNDVESADPCLMYLRNLNVPETIVPSNGQLPEPTNPCLIDLDVSESAGPSNGQHPEPEPPMLNFGSVDEFLAWDPSMPEGI